MAILTHGTDLSLAPTVRPILKVTGGTLANALSVLSKQGFTATQLDATVPSLRPRELDARGRKDLQALLIRQGFQLAGIDFFIPKAHYVDPAHMDRALSATLAAIELAADLGRVPLSLRLPRDAMVGEAGRVLIEAADGRGVRLAVHGEDAGEKAGEDWFNWLRDVDVHALGGGLDPASWLSRNQDPSSMAGRLGPHLAVARLNDVPDGNTAGGESIPRCPVGQGMLDVLTYRMALDLATARTGPVVLDLQGLLQPIPAAAEAKRVWDKATFTV